MNYCPIPFPHSHIADKPNECTDYRIGTVVLDPETDVRYTYRPDLNADAPFLNDGEFFTLAGVNEEIAS